MVMVEEIRTYKNQNTWKKPKNLKEIYVTAKLIIQDRKIKFTPELIYKCRYTCFLGGHDTRNLALDRAITHAIHILNEEFTK